MAKRKTQKVEADVVETDVVETEVKVRKTKIDYIPEDMIEEFNQLQATLAARKAEGRRVASKMSPEEAQAKLEKLQKRMAALNAMLGQ